MCRVSRPFAPAAPLKGCLVQRLLQIASFVLVLGSVAPATAQAADLDWIAEIIMDRATAHGVSGRWLISVAHCESGWNPWAIGSAGEKGLFQLHPRGELLGFYRRGYTDPFDVYEAADFTALRFAEGASGAWTCAR